MKDEIKYPSFLKRIYICLFKKRKEWRRARAASTLLVWAWNNWRDEYGFLEKLHDELWRNIYD